MSKFQFQLCMGRKPQFARTNAAPEVVNVRHALVKRDMAANARREAVYGVVALTITLAAVAGALFVFLKVQP